MSIELNPGFRGEIAILTRNDHLVFKKEITSQEQLTKFLNKYSLSRDGRGIFLKSIYPLNTESLALLARDVFIPNFFQHVLTIDSIAVKIFTLILDLITLPIRIITAPFKIVIDRLNPETPHAIAKMIEKKCNNKISDEYVSIWYRTEEVSFQEDVNRFAIKKNVEGSVFVALKTTHAHSAGKTEQATSASYISSDGKWVKMAKISGGVTGS